ncbi:MAG: hypothetical protein ACXVB0_16550 [Mucilaginibacter sp.]
MVLLSVAFIFSSWLCADNVQITIAGSQTKNSHYRLTISEAKIPLLKDTVFGGNQCLITRCPLTLTNNTDDTLKYVGMSFSWWDFYSLDNRNFALAADYWNVFKNERVILVLPPHQSVTSNIKIVTYKEYYRGEKLRIAMRLQKVVHVPIAGDITPIGAESNELIWSNGVALR